MGSDIDEVARAQAMILIVELERVADDLVDQLEKPGVTHHHLVTARRELYEVREHVRRLQQTYSIGHGS